MGRVGRQLRAAFKSDPAAIGVLYQLSRSGPVRISALANALALDVSTTSRHVRGLETDELVERQADPEDGRATLLHITEAGRQFLADAIAERSAVLRAATAGWDEHDLTALNHYLARLADDLANLTGETLA